MTRSGGPTGERSGKGRLIVLTGASHTGKSSVAAEIVRLTNPPVALLGVDSTLDNTLLRPPGDRWAEIPLAYELNRAQMAPLLRQGWLVIFESTFTYVPEDRPPEFHRLELDRIITTAEAVSPPPLVVHLDVPEATVVDRARHTGRLDPEIVRRTVGLHESFDSLPGMLRIRGADSPSEATARKILAALGSGS